jgi:hypothetical protein
MRFVDAAAQSLHAPQHYIRAVLGAAATPAPGASGGT